MFRLLAIFWCVSISGVAIAERSRGGSSDRLDTITDTVSGLGAPSNRIEDAAAAEPAPQPTPPPPPTAQPAPQPPAQPQVPPTATPRCGTGLADCGGLNTSGRPLCCQNPELCDRRNRTCIGQNSPCPLTYNACPDGATGANLKICCPATTTCTDGTRCKEDNCPDGELGCGSQCCKRGESCVKDNSANQPGYTCQPNGPHNCAAGTFPCGPTRCCADGQTCTVWNLNSGGIGVQCCPPGLLPVPGTNECMEPEENFCCDTGRRVQRQVNGQVVVEPVYERCAFGLKCCPGGGKNVRCDSLSNLTCCADVVQQCSAVVENGKQKGTCIQRPEVKALGDMQLNELQVLLDSVRGSEASLNPSMSRAP